MAYVMLGRVIQHKSPVELTDESAVEYYTTVKRRGEQMKLRPRRPDKPMREQPPHRELTPDELDDLIEAWDNRKDA